VTSHESDDDETCDEKDADACNFKQQPKHRVSVARGRVGMV